MIPPFPYVCLAIVQNTPNNYGILRIIIVSLPHKINQKLSSGIYRWGMGGITGPLYLMQFHQPDSYHAAYAMKCLEMIFDFSIPDLLSHEGAIEIGK